MKELRELLMQVKDSYYDFVLGILAYTGKNTERQKIVTDYIKDNPDASSSDIVFFVSNQPDFFDNIRKDNEKNNIAAIN